MKAIEMSISSICKYTGYVGMTEQQVFHDNVEKMFYDYSSMKCRRAQLRPMNCCYSAAPPPPMMNCCYAAPPPPMACSQSLQQQQMTSLTAFQPLKTESMHDGADKKQGYPTKYDLIQLTRYQKAGGFWENLEAVKSITGIKLDCIDDANLPDKTIESRCVATILAIAAMRTKSSKEKNLWAMIEQKDLIWLKKNFA